MDRNLDDFLLADHSTLSKLQLSGLLKERNMSELYGPRTLGIMQIIGYNTTQYQGKSIFKIKNRFGTTPLKEAAGTTGSAKHQVQNQKFISESSVHSPDAEHGAISPLPLDADIDSLDGIDNLFNPEF